MASPSTSASRKPPQVPSLRIAKKNRRGVVPYANVQSRNRATHCSCEAKSFNPSAPDDHATAVRQKLARRQAPARRLKRAV